MLSDRHGNIFIHPFILANTKFKRQVVPVLNSDKGSQAGTTTYSIFPTGGWIIRGGVPNVVATLPVIESHPCLSHHSFCPYSVRGHLSALGGDVHHVPPLSTGAGLRPGSLFGVGAHGAEGRRGRAR